jgi:hypothetical protein
MWVVWTQYWKDLAYKDLCEGKQAICSFISGLNMKNNCQGLTACLFLSTFEWILCRMSGKKIFDVPCLSAFHQQWCDDMK